MRSRFAARSSLLGSICVIRSTWRARAVQVLSIERRAASALSALTAVCALTPVSALTAMSALAAMLALTGVLVLTGVPVLTVVPLSVAVSAWTPVIGCNILA